MSSVPSRPSAVTVAMLPLAPAAGEPVHPENAIQAESQPLIEADPHPWADPAGRRNAHRTLRRRRQLRVRMKLHLGDLLAEVWDLNNPIVPQRAPSGVNNLDGPLS